MNYVIGIKNVMLMKIIYIYFLFSQIRKRKRSRSKRDDGTSKIKRDGKSDEKCQRFPEFAGPSKSSS